MGQFQDVKWPAEYNELTRIEDLLHCRICYEYISTCVVTPCSHNYCSRCIRQFLHFKTQCPICFETIYEKDLHANRVLDEFMECYISLREKLLSCIKGVEVKHDDFGEKTLKFTPTKKPKTPVKNINSIIETPKKLSRDNASTSFKSFDELKDTEVSTTQTPVKYIPSPSTSYITPKKNRIFFNKSELKVQTEISKKRVPCPVCGIEISETFVNKHLDDCLKRQKSMSPVPQQDAKNNLKPMPKYVVNLMKDSMLRKVLKEYGLSTSGVRKTLEKRLQKFAILYNSERDKLVPKSIEDIVKLCEVEESIEKNISKLNSPSATLNIDRKADSTLIDKAHKQYIERNKDDYRKLIQSINERDKVENKSSRSLFGLKTEEASVATTSSASQSSIFNQSDEFNDTRSSIADTSYFNIHDASNSTNASYPLQHYSNDDPMRYLALEISRSPIKFRNSSSNSRNDSPIAPKVEFETSQQGSENSLDEIVSSNSTFFDDKEEEKELKEVEKDKIDDIYDLSTEDNCSDSCSKERSTNNKTKNKYLTKRTKVNEEDDNRSTDSETDIETDFRSVNRKTAKKKDSKNNETDLFAGRENDNDDEVDLNDIDEENSSNELKENKENFQVENIANDVTTFARRSNRKRNHVSNYASGSKSSTEKVMKKNDNKDDKRFINLRDEPLKENPTNVVIVNKDEKNEEEFINARKKSLRKRPKL